jgi:predicted membrane protein
MLAQFKFKKTSELPLPDRIRRLKLLRILSISFFMFEFLLMAAGLMFFLYGYVSLPAYRVSLAIPLRNWFSNFGMLFAIGLVMGWSVTYCYNSYGYFNEKLKAAVTTQRTWAAAKIEAMPNA